MRGAKPINNDDSTPTSACSCAKYPASNPGPATPDIVTMRGVECFLSHSAKG